MITYKQLTLAEIFDDCKINSTMTNTSSFHFLMKPLTLMKLFLFLLFLIFTLQPEASQAPALSNAQSTSAPAYFLNPD